ncbi:MAG: PQQ-binding-like beta-propeller repeat protein [Gammaproteobacteria bacterium]|nr:PQQ-binding-like beta-propeller repeat protein [Gammaproteobacteria bacterium]
MHKQTLKENCSKICGAYPDRYFLYLSKKFLKIFLSTIFVFASITVLAKPEYIAQAMEYGAKDCSFCHATALGGEAVNERGQWLIEERERRKTDEIDVAWLESRGDEVVETPDETTEDLEDAISERPSDDLTSNSTEIAIDPERPFDFTTNFGEWPAYGGDIGARKYSPLNQITRENLSQLQLAWVWESETDKGVRNERDAAKAPDMFKGTPLMVDGRLFMRTRYSAVEAVDAQSGETLWTYDPGTREGPRPAMFGFTTRGLAFFKDKSGGRILLVTSRGWLIALDAESGELIEGFGTKGKVDLRKGLRRPLDPRQIAWSHAPNVCGDVVVIGSQPTDDSHSWSFSPPWNSNLPLGDVRGFDVKTGEQKWVFKTVPQEGEVGNETWGNESWKWMGNTNVWSTTSCDPELNLVYLPVTAPTNHFYGGARPGDNLFGTSLVAVDASTGEYVWHFQNVRHDIWDYDNPAAPVVADIHRNGKTVKVVAQVTKTGYLFVFERATGEPIWEIEDVEVPGSDLEGEQPSPTQPRPTWPPPFEMQGLVEENVIDFTPEIRERAMAALSKFKIGPLFTTPSTKGTLILPGIGGGANWGGAAFDPVDQSLFVASRRQPTLIISFPEKRNRGIKYNGIFTMPSFERGLPYIKPPWSSITAYDLNTGDIKWTVPNGRGPVDHPLLSDLNLPALGQIGAAPGLLVTPTAIFFGSRDRGNQLIAMDKSNGKVLWRHNIAGFFSDAPPITYMFGNKQYLVIGTGGSWEPARMVAFALQSSD